MDVSHFSMVGFTHAGEARVGLEQLAQAQLKICQPKPLDDAHVSCVVRDRTGAELWFGLGKIGNQFRIQTLNPAFSGESRLKLRIDGDASDPEWKPFETRIAARFSGQATPIVFDLADPEQARLATPGQDVTVAIAAFSYAPELYRDESAFYAAQKKTGEHAALGAAYFIPSGMLLEEFGGALRKGAERPEAYADFAATVLKADLRKNATGGASFWWVLVKTYEGATVDLVLDPSTISLEPRPGYIVSGRFWMSGRIVNAP